MQKTIVITLVFTILTASIMADKDYNLCEHIWKDNGNFFPAPADAIQPIHVRRNSKQSDLLLSEANGALSVVPSKPTGLFNTDAREPISQGDFCNTGGGKIYVADMNGDHYDDMLCRKSDGTFTVRYYQRNMFGPEKPFAQNFDCGTVADIDILLGDFDGNNANDILCYDKDGITLASSPVYFSQINCFNHHYSPYERVHGRFRHNSHRFSRHARQPLCDRKLPLVSTLPFGALGECDMSTASPAISVLDANGDGKDDVMCLIDSQSFTYLSHGLRDGMLFSDQHFSVVDGCSNSDEILIPADIDGDGDDDLNCFSNTIQAHSRLVSFFSDGKYDSTAAEFRCTPSQTKFCYDAALVNNPVVYYSGDFNGDGRDDVMCRYIDTSVPGNPVIKTNIVFAEYFLQVV